MDFYEQVPKDFAENLRYRLKLRQRAEKDLRFREALILACRADILFFLSAFCYLHEPRPMKDAEGRTLPEIIPFIPWAHQVPIIRTIRENIGFEDIGCLGGDVGVVSHRGVVRIKDIRKDDLIWDGDNFVSHGGVISRGIKQVIRAYGLTMTPDHLVLTTKGWQRADQGISRATVRMPDSYRWNSSEDEVQVRLRGRKDLPTSRCLEGNSERRESELLSFLSTRNKIDSFARDVKKDWKNKAIQCLGGYGWKVYQGIASCLRLLRWPWHNSMRGMAQIQQLLEGHEGFLLAGFDSGQARQQRSLLSEKLLVGQQEGTSEQHAKQSLGRHYSRRDDCISGRRYSRNNLVVHERKSRHRMDEGEIVAEEVYDILDCGPLNRFVVIGDQPTVVHNCEKARGEGMSWIAVYIALHDWVFAIPGTRMVSIGVVSRNLEMADSPDDPASLGWKFDWALKRLPKWMVGAEVFWETEVKCGRMATKHGRTYVEEPSEWFGHHLLRCDCRDWIGRSVHLLFAR